MITLLFPGNFDLELQNNFKALLIMHWFPKIQKTLTRARFFLASRKCRSRTKILSKASLKSVTQTYNGETWHSYIIPRGDPKNI